MYEMSQKSRVSTEKELRAHLFKKKTEKMHQCLDINGYK